MHKLLWLPQYYKNVQENKKCCYVFCFCGISYYICDKCLQISLVRELFMATVQPAAISMDVTMGTDGRKFISNGKQSQKKRQEAEKETQK